MLRCKRCGFNLWGGNQGGWKRDVKFEMSARGPHGSQEKEGWEHQHTERESNRARVKTARHPGKSMCGRARANRVLRSGEGLEGRCTGQWGLGSKWRDWTDNSEVRALTTLAEDASSVPSSHTGELTTAWGFSSRKEAHTQLSWKGVGF